jgi:putative tricarboxylic transport membrane protein
MDLFDSVISGFEVALAPRNILWVFLGALIGMIIGVLPGIGPVPTIMLLLPITYELPPDSAIILLAGVYYGAMYGGTITSVLLKVPGEAASVITVIDGYQMAKQGRAGSALGIAAIGSFIGGTVAILGLTLGAPVLARHALSFGPPEYTILALLGILMVATLTTGSTLKAVIAAAAGLLLATIGLDQFVGSERFTGGVLELSDGLDFVTLAMGLFGLGEIFYALDHRARQTFAALPFNNVWPSRSDIRESRWSILRGSMLGFGLGVLPGGSGTLSSMASYTLERKVSKSPWRFGRGAIEGVAGPETANNAAATAAFVPLLTLGIPTNAVMAVILGGLMLQGVAPGPNLINERPDIFWGVIDSMYLGNVLLLIMSIPLVGLFVKLVAVRESILAPIVVVVVMLGTYTISNTIFDMWIVIVFGIIGYLMRKTGFDPGPLLLAFVLGAILENSFRQSLRMFSGDMMGFVQRPISGTLVALIALVIVVPVVLRIVRSRLRAPLPGPEPVSSRDGSE